MLADCFYGKMVKRGKRNETIHVTLTMAVRMSPTSSTIKRPLRLTRRLANGGIESDQELLRARVIFPVRLEDEYFLRRVDFTALNKKELSQIPRCLRSSLVCNVFDCHHGTSLRSHLTRVLSKRVSRSFNLKDRVRVVFWNNSIMAHFCSPFCPRCKPKSLAKFHSTPHR